MLRKTKLMLKEHKLRCLGKLELMPKVRYVLKRLRAMLKLRKKKKYLYSNPYNPKIKFTQNTQKYKNGRLN